MTKIFRHYVTTHLVNKRNNKIFSCLWELTDCHFSCKLLERTQGVNCVVRDLNCIR